MDIVDRVAEQNEDLQKELNKLLKKKKTGKKLIAVGVAVMLILVAAASALLYGEHLGKKNAENELAELNAKIQEQDEQIQELINTPIVVNPAAPMINLDMLRSEIQDISELATTEYLFTDVATFSDSKQIKNWNIPFTEKSFICKWDGSIKAGIDLKQVQFEVNADEQIITVTVPKAEILSYEVNQDSVQMLSEKDNIFNNISIEDKIKVDAATEKKMKERAIENNILEKAQKNAQSALLGIILTNPDVSGFYTVEFVVAE